MAVNASSSPEGVRERWQSDLDPIPPGWGHVWEAYTELDTCRSITMGGTGPIPWTAIAAYTAGMGETDAEELRIIVRRLDRMFLTAQAKKQATKRKPKKRG